MTNSTHRNFFSFTCAASIPGSEQHEPVAVQRTINDDFARHFGPEDELNGEFGLDFNKELRRDHLLTRVAERRGAPSNTAKRPHFSAGFVLEEAANRYFMLLQSAQDGMKGMFSAEELSIIMGAECGPVWQWDVGMPVVAMVAGDQGIDSIDELPEGSPMQRLLEKLDGLTELQNAALTDACERAWRGYENPLL